MEGIEKDVLIFQLKISLSELLRERFNNMIDQPYGHARESELISILQACEEGGIRTDLIFCSRQEFEIEKSHARI